MFTLILEVLVSVLTAAVSVVTASIRIWFVTLRSHVSAEEAAPGLVRV